MSLICMLLAPITAVSKKIGVKFQHGLSTNTNDLQKEANLLCGDAIINYKTVQSFGHEDLIANKYEEML